MNKKLEPHLKAAALREQINETKKSFGNLDPLSNLSQDEKKKLILKFKM